MPQWGEVKKKAKDRSQSKQPQDSSTPAEPLAPHSKGGRGRGGADAIRGGRGRGSDRGSDRSRGGVRGGRVARGTTPKVNGHQAGNKAQQDGWGTETAVGAWDTTTTDTDSAALDSSWENVTAEQAEPPTQEENKATSKHEPPKTWAAMFAKPKPAPPAKAPKAVPAHEPPSDPVAAPATTMEPLPPVVSSNETETPSTPPTSDLAGSEQTVEITPPKDDLTEDNLEKLPDNSGPAITATAASTAASTVDQRVISGTPLATSQAPQTTRPPLGGFATSAYKATGLAGRTSSYQRKIMEQQEAVVMPGKHAVDKAAVQFGSMGLNGAPDDLDVDSDREDAETRAQPPQHSPIAPRASLPPAPLQQANAFPQAEPEPQQRPAPGLPPVTQATPLQNQPQVSAAESLTAAQRGYPYDQFSSQYSQASAQPDVSAPTQKPYEPFGNQLQQSQHYDPFQGTGYGNFGNEAPRQYLESKGASGPGHTSSYYTSDEQQNRHPGFQHGQYGLGQSHSGPEPTPSQHRTSNDIGSSAPSQPSQQATAHGRFGNATDAQGSGHSTPYQQSGNHPHGSAPGHGYGYGYPYGGYYPSYMSQMNNPPYGRERQTFDDPRRFEEYQNSSYGFGGQAGYAGSHYGAGGKNPYSQGHPGYGMSAQTSHDQHSSSPATAGAFGGQLPTSGRESAVGGLSGYGGRSGSTQPSDQLHPSSQTSHDLFGGRSGSAYQGQNQGLGSSNDDPLRNYNESSKVPGGPSPALGQSGNRPGSAVNPQTGLPPQDARFQQGYGYPSHSQYGAGPGGAGAHGSQGGSHQGYGGYGAAGGYGGSYYGSNNRGGGWANYGH